MVILNWSVTLYGPASIYAPLAFVVVAAGFWGLSVIVLSWLDLTAFPASLRWERHFEWFNALVVVALLGAWTYVQFHNTPATQQTSSRSTSTRHSSWPMVCTTPTCTRWRTRGRCSVSPRRIHVHDKRDSRAGVVISVAVVPDLRAVHPARLDQRGRRRPERGRLGGLGPADVLVAAAPAPSCRPRALEHRRLPRVRDRRRHRHALHPAADRGGLQVGPVRIEPRLLSGAGGDGTRDGDQADALAGARLRALRAGDGRVRPLWEPESGVAARRPLPRGGGRGIPDPRTCRT